LNVSLAVEILTICDSLWGGVHGGLVVSLIDCQSIGSCSHPGQGRN